MMRCRGDNVSPGSVPFRCVLRVSAEFFWVLRIGNHCTDSVAIKALSIVHVLMFSFFFTVMNDSDNPSQRQETWHEDDHEYYARLHVTLIVAGMENYPIFLGTVYWIVSRSSYGRGRFSVRFVPASQ